MSPKGKLNLCFLGCGSITHRHSKTARSFAEELNLLYASRSLRKAREYEQSHDGIDAFGSYEEACSSNNVDAVFICTPPHLHVELLRLAAESGKAIIIEKPVARSLAELAEMDAILHAADVPCMVAENYHFKPSLRLLRDWINEGAIGTPLFVEISHTSSSRPTGWRQDANIMGGGALLEGGVHWVRTLTALGGAIDEVAAIQPAADYEPMAPIEDSMLLLVRFRSGAAGKLLHSWAVPNPLKGIEFSRVLGTDGTIHFESNGLILILNGRRRAMRFPSFTDFLGFRAMLQAFIIYLRQGGASPLSLTDIRHDHALIDAAYRSVKSRKFEKVDTSIRLTDDQKE